jgi:hypothetical protein
MRGLNAQQIMCLATSLPPYDTHLDCAMVAPAHVWADLERRGLVRSCGCSWYAGCRCEGTVFTMTTPLGIFLLTLHQSGVV